jgi:NitT/TauT family transport system permease protein
MSVDAPMNAPTGHGEVASAGAVADPITATRSRRSGSVLSVVLPPVLLGIAIIGAWYFVSYVVLADDKRFLLRPLHQVVDVGFLEWDNFSEILEALWQSTKVALFGLVISVALGMAIAVLMSQSKLAERAIFPYMVTLQAIPILAIVPLIGFWFGYGMKSRVFVCVIISIFPIIVNTLFGLQSAERGMHDLFTLHHAGRVTRLRKLMFPAAMPAIFAGLRISAGLSVIGAVVGDFFFGQGKAGLGQLLKKYAVQLQGEQLLASVIMTALLGVTVFWTFGFLQSRAIGKWYESTGGK